MAKRPFLFALPSIDDEPSLAEIVSSIAMDALLDARTSIPPRAVSGFELEQAIWNNLDALVSAYMRENGPRDAASAF